jgi:hypothetical protein
MYTRAKLKVTVSNPAFHPILAKSEMILLPG